LRIPFIAKKYAKAQLSATDAHTRAELVLIRLIQQKYFGLELQMLRDKLQVKSDLDLFLHDDGILRCRGRLETAPIAWDTVHPIYLPRNSRLVRTLISCYYRKLLHAGAEHTLTASRERSEGGR